MKLMLSISVLFLCCTFCNSQNLVPNPSFEEYIECPPSAGDFDGFIEDWVRWRGSPDYFHECSPFAGVPSSEWNYQDALTGAGYAALANHRIDWNNYREHMAVELIEPLVIGQTYYLSYYVSLCWNDGVVGAACNNHCARFTVTEHHPGDPPPLSNWAHIVNEEIITDTLLWTQVKGSFTADSSYIYMVLGNFFDDDNTAFDNLGDESQLEAWYLIDEVRLSTDSAFVCENIAPTQIFENHELELRVYPNPADEVVRIESGKLMIQHLSLQTITGKKLSSWNEPGLSHFIDLRDFQPGMYLLVIAYSNRQTAVRKIVVE